MAAKDNVKQAKFLPDYEVHEIKEEVMVQKTRFSPAIEVKGRKTNPGKFEHYTEKAEHAWLVCFPRRHSILVTSKEQMIHLGFAEYDEDGEFVLKAPTITDHKSGMRLDGDSSVQSLAGIIGMQTSLKNLGRIPMTIGKVE